LWDQEWEVPKKVLAIRFEEDPEETSGFESGRYVSVGAGLGSE
jgi:hypothetical protein